MNLHAGPPHGFFLPKTNSLRKREPAVKPTRLLRSSSPAFLFFALITAFGFLAKNSKTPEFTANMAYELRSEVSEISEQQHIFENYGKLPMCFEVNQGQFAEQVKFVTRGHGYTLFLTQNEAVMALRNGSQKSEVNSQGRARSDQDRISDDHKPESGNRNSPPEIEDPQSTVVRMKLVDANPKPVVSGQDELQGKSHYLLGGISEWHTHALNYQKVRYDEVYPGIDLVYYGNQQQLEYDFVVSPNANPEVIQIAFEGTKRLSFDSNGDAILQTDDNKIVLRKPIIYQEKAEERRHIEGEYVASGENRLAFAVGDYDSTLPLVIDPVLVYATFLGNGDGSADDIAVDATGHVYLTGHTSSPDFPTTPGAFDTDYNGDDVFVTKLTPDGSSLVYSTLLGGEGDDQSSGIAVDAAGYVYVSGHTSSADFPTTPGAFESDYSGAASGDVFVIKLTPDGSGLVYSSFLGSGDFRNLSGGIAIDGAGHAYVVGYTTNPDFPTTPGAFDTSYNGNTDVFVTKLTSDASGLVYSTFLGGENLDAVDRGGGIALDAAGSAYVTGRTFSEDFPTTPGAHRTRLHTDSEYVSDHVDIFVTKLTQDGGDLAYSTFLGHRERDYGEDIVVDTAGCAYVTATIEYGGYDSGVVAKFKPDGSDLLFEIDREVFDFSQVALDTFGNAYITGRTRYDEEEAEDYITPGAFDRTYNGGSSDAFVAKVTSGGKFMYFSFLGGSDSDIGRVIAVDAFGSVYVGGSTSSPDFPTTAGAFDVNFSGTKAPAGYSLPDAFLVKMIVPPPSPPTITSFMPASGPLGTEVTIAGAKFTGTITVLFNGTSASSFEVDSDTQLRATVPLEAISGPISVTTGPARCGYYCTTHTTTSTDDFAVMEPPTVGFFNPTSGSVGDEVTVSGSYLTSTIDVAFNGVSATDYTVDSDTLVHATVPAGATTGPISVTNAAGTTASTTDFTVLTTQTFKPTDDAYVITSKPANTFNGSTLRVKKNGSTTFDSYLKFDVNGLAGTVQKALLRLYCTDGSPDGGSAFLVSNDFSANGTPWSESALTATNAPGISNMVSGSVGAVSENAPVEFDVSAAVAGNGVVSFAIRNENDNDDMARYSSKEGPTAPELVITTGSTGGSSNPPSISSFIPTSGLAGTDVTLVGNNFSGTTSVSFNGAASIFSVVSNSELRATVPDAATNGPIHVTTLHGSSTSSSNFTVMATPPQPSSPVIASFTPASGPVGTVVTISGSHFTGTTLVTFNALASSFSLISDNEIRATVPNNATTGQIAVKTADGTATSSTDFTVTSTPPPPSPPTIASFTPTSGFAGYEVTISGSHFSGTTLVSFNGVAASFSFDSDSQLRARAPNGATTGPISVVNAVGIATSTSDFTVMTSTGGSQTLTFRPTDDAYVISGSPTNNYNGNTIRVRKTGSVYTSYLKFDLSGLGGPVQNAVLRLFCMDGGPDGGAIFPVANNFANTGTTWTETALTAANAPAVSGAPISSAGVVSTNAPIEFDVTGAIIGNGTISFAIQNQDDNVVRYSSKEGPTVPELIITTGSTGVPSNPPSITSFIPVSGPVGTKVTIVGSHFAGTTSVSFNGAASSFSALSNSEIHATVPNSATSGPIMVMTGDGTATSLSNFTVTGTPPPPSPPAIVSFTPVSGFVANEVTLSGSHFTGTALVSFNGVAASFSFDSDSQLRARAPNGATTGPISVTNAAGTALSPSDFTVMTSTGNSQTLTFRPTDDAYVISSKPDNTFNGSTLRIKRNGSTTFDSYMKFDVNGLAGTVQKAMLKLYCTDGSSDGGSVFLVSNSFSTNGTPWVEAALTAGNAPAVSGLVSGSVGVVTESAFVEFDVTGAIVGNGLVSFAIRNEHDNDDMVRYSSKEGSMAPELIIETASTLSRTFVEEMQPELADYLRTELAEEPEGILPDKVSILPNYPNPFNMETMIEYTLPEKASVKLVLYNLRGQEVRKLVDEIQAPGFKAVRWNGKDNFGSEIGSGIYFVRLNVGAEVLSRKVVLQK